MRFGLPREFASSLRFRLVFWNTVVLLGSLLLTLIVLRESVRYSLVAEFEKQLFEDLDEVKMTVQQNHRAPEDMYDELERKAISHSHRGWWARLFDHEGRILWNSHNAPLPPLPVSPFESYDRIVSHNHYRKINHRFDSPGLPRWIVRVGVSFAPIEADIQRLTAQIAMIGLVAILLTPIGAFFLAGRATQPIATIIDTARKMQPQSLRERLPSRGTRDELDRLADTINGLLDRIHAYINRNREFTSNAAHELRSPLAAIRSSLEVALDTDRSIDVYKSLLADVLEQCEELSNLVNQLLTLSETDAGLALGAEESVDLAELVERSVQMFQGVADVTGVRLTLVPANGETRVRGQTSRLRQVVNNLIDNAIKFTPPGGHVTVRLGASHSNGRVLLSVADTGEGIAPADLPHIFERFYRADRSRRRTDGPRGTGLGLSICEAIVQSHGGELTVHSELARGSTFTVSLPMDSVAGRKPSAHDNGVDSSAPPASGTPSGPFPK
jgi:heavy metal sensor kinase